MKVSQQPARSAPFRVVCCLVLLCFTGCLQEPAEPFNSVEDVTQTEIDEYTAMVEASQRELQRNMEAREAWAEKHQADAADSAADSPTGAGPTGNDTVPVDAQGPAGSEQTPAASGDDAELNRTDSASLLEP